MDTFTLIDTIFNQSVPKTRSHIYIPYLHEEENYLHLLFSRTETVNHAKIDWAVNILTVFFGIISLFGLFMNVIVVIAVITCKFMRKSAMNMMILNLVRKNVE